MRQLNEIETSGWVIKVGDVFSNGHEPFHLKVTKIEVGYREEEEDFAIVEYGLDNFDPDDALIYYEMIDPNNHNEVVKEDEHIEEADNWHRAWYINEYWYK